MIAQVTLPLTGESRHVFGGQNQAREHLAPRLQKNKSRQRRARERVSPRYMLTSQVKWALTGEPRHVLGGQVQAREHLAPRRADVHLGVELAGDFEEDALLA